MSVNENQKNAGEATEDGQQDINDLDIRKIQELRKSFINDLVKNDKPPSDPEDRAFILAVMQHTTQTALATKKIKADEKAATSNANVVRNLAEVIRSANAHASAENRRKQAAPQREVPQVEVKTVPGHTDVGTFPISTTSIANGGDGNMSAKD